MKSAKDILFITATLVFAPSTGPHRLTSPGTIVTMADNTWTVGAAGDGGPATAATLHQPVRGVVDSSGKFYFSDSLNNEVRRIAPNGAIATVAGVTGGGFSGDSGPATSARLNGPAGLAVDSQGDLYIANSLNFVSNSTGICTVSGARVALLSPGVCSITPTQAGNAALAAASPVTRTFQVTVLSLVTASGIIATVSGNGVAGGGGDGGAALAAYLHGPVVFAKLNAPSDIYPDGRGGLLIADTGNNVIRKLGADGSINAAAGDISLGAGYSGDGGPALPISGFNLIGPFVGSHSIPGAHFNQPQGVAVDSIGNVFISDSSNNRIRGYAWPNVPPANPLARYVLSRGPATNEISVRITVTITGTAAALAAQVTSVTVGNTSTESPLRVLLGDIPPGSSAQATVRFPGLVGQPGTAAILKLAGSAEGDINFGGNTRVTDSDRGGLRPIRPSIQYHRRTRTVLFFAWRGWPDGGEGTRLALKAQGAASRSSDVLTRLRSIVNRLEQGTEQQHQG